MKTYTFYIYIQIRLLQYMLCIYICCFVKNKNFVLLTLCPYMYNIHVYVWEGGGGIHNSKIVEYDIYAYDLCRSFAYHACSHSVPHTTTQLRILRTET